MKEIKTYSTQIIDQIKGALLRGELKPGDKVNEVSLADSLSISRAPVREALQMMVNEGLVESIPQRGKFIKALTAKEIRDSYFIGGVLEGAAVASNIKRFTEKDFTALEETLEAMKNLREKEPTYAEEFAGLDIAFHETLLARADNKLLIEHSRAICQRMSKFLLFQYWPHAFTHKKVVGRHEKILEAVRSRSPERIESVIRHHYQELGERMARFGCDQPRPFRRIDKKKPSHGTAVRRSGS